MEELFDEDTNEIFLSLFNDQSDVEDNYKSIKTNMIHDVDTHIEYKILSALLFISNISKENYISSNK